MKKKEDIFNIFAQNIHCWYPLEPPRLGGSNSTHNVHVCFGAKNKKIRNTPAIPNKRKLGIPLFFYIQVNLIITLSLGSIETDRVINETML